MAFESLELIPGVVATPTKHSKSLNWSDANYIRWVAGKLQPVGGWEQTTIPATASPIRKWFDWADNDRNRWVAMLCDSHAYVMSRGMVYDITPEGGMASPSASFLAGGYGDDIYNYDDYGTPRPATLSPAILGGVFSLMNWGEDLLFMTSFDGKLYRWSPQTPTDAAELVAAAPTDNRGFVVTPERHVILFDYDANQGQFAWCDQEDLDNWEFADTTSKAGFLPVYPVASHVASVPFMGRTLAFTTLNAYTINHVGLPFVYGFDLVGEHNIPVSDRAIFTTPAGPIWMAEGGFWLFNGVSIQPIECPLWNWIESQIDNLMARFLVHTVHIENRSELWFFFPSTNAQNQKNDRYVIYNYKENWWSNGRLSRSSGLSSSYLSYPLMADDIKVFQHEYGNTYQGVTEFPWIESFTFSEPRGGGDLTFRQLQPDMEGDFQSVRFSLTYRNKLSGGQTFVTPDRQCLGGYVSFLQTGKEFRLKIKVTENSARQWTLGNSGVDMTTRGVRRAG